MYMFTIGPSNPTRSEMETYVHTKTCTQCLEQIYPQSSKTRNNPMSLNHMGKQTMVHPGNRILFNNKNEPSIDACNKFDESKHTMLRERNRTQKV